MILHAERIDLIRFHLKENYSKVCFVFHFSSAAAATSVGINVGAIYTQDSGAAAVRPVAVVLNHL